MVLAFVLLSIKDASDGGFGLMIRRARASPEAFFWHCDFLFFFFSSTTTLSSDEGCEWVVLMEFLDSDNVPTQQTSRLRRRKSEVEGGAFFS